MIGGLRKPASYNRYNRLIGFGFLLFGLLCIYVFSLIRFHCNCNSSLKVLTGEAKEEVRIF